MSNKETRSSQGEEPELPLLTQRSPDSILSEIRKLEKIGGMDFEADLLKREARQLDEISELPKKK